MRRSARTLFWFLFPLVFISSTAINVHAQDVAGNWRGDGVIRPKNFDDKQKVRCRVKGTYDQEGKSILAGRCATASRSGKFWLEIAGSADSNVVQATMLMIGSNRKFEFSGRRADTGYTLTSIRPILQHGRKIASRFTVSTNKQGAMLIREVVTDLKTGETIEPLNLEFKRQSK